MENILNQNLTIADGDINSLAGLSQLIAINAELKIQSDGLTNLSGLNNVAFIDYLNICASSKTPFFLGRNYKKNDS